MKSRSTSGHANSEIAKQAIAEQVTVTLSLRDQFGKVRLMNDSTNRLSEFFESNGQPNTLWRYVQSMSPETAAQLSKPESPEVLQVMERNIVGLLGGLPAEQFDVAVTTSREGLGRLLASAMMSGYFLRNVEQRMDFERSFQSLELGASEDS